MMTPNICFSREFNSNYLISIAVVWEKALQQSSVLWSLYCNYTQYKYTTHAHTHSTLAKECWISFLHWIRLKWSKCISYNRFRKALRGHLISAWSFFNIFLGTLWRCQLGVECDYIVTILQHKHLIYRSSFTFSFWCKLTKPDSSQFNLK